MPPAVQRGGHRTDLVRFTGAGAHDGAYPVAPAEVQFAVQPGSLRPGGGPVEPQKSRPPSALRRHWLHPRSSPMTSAGSSSGGTSSFSTSMTVCRVTLSRFILRQDSEDRSCSGHVDVQFVCHPEHGTAEQVSLIKFVLTLIIPLK